MILHGFKENLAPKINEKSLATKIETIKLIDPLEHLEDLYAFDGSIMQGLREKEKMKAQQTFEIENSAKEIKINW
ncbi:hypothetical protein D3C72_1982840 [compost metagenome]